MTTANTSSTARLVWIRSSPVVVTLVVATLYVSWFARFVAPTEPASHAQIGTAWLDRGSENSEAIDALRPLAGTRIGYDGQFALFIALAPLAAEAYIDDPAYRYGRILYPIVARVVAFGSVKAIPWTLLLVNLVAAVLLTSCAAVFLRSRGASPWYALLLGLSPGLLAGVSQDLTEPLAFFLVALGLILALNRGRRAMLLAGLMFALAGLTRESTVVFCLVLGVCLAVGIGEYGRPVPRRLRDALTVTLIGVAPILVLKTVLVVLMPGEMFPSNNRFELIPFTGLWSHWPFGENDLIQVFTVVLPACLGLLLVAISVRRLTIVTVALACNVLLFILLLPSAPYEHPLNSSRIALGVPLAFVFSLPLIDGRKRLLVASAPIACWMLAWI